MLLEWKEIYGEQVKNENSFRISIFGTVRRLRE